MLKYLTMKEASEILPGSPSPCTVYRWCQHGVPVRGTWQRAKLRHTYVGRKMFTSQEWIEDFLTALDTDRPDEEICGRHPARAGRKRRLEQADAILRQAGI